MTLSPTELADIRLMTGADDTAIISDALIQTQYTSAAANAPDSSLILPFTYVYVLRRLYGYQRTKANRTTDFGDNETRDSVTENTKALLDYWEGQAGLGGVGIITSGALNLALDTVDTDEDT